MKAIFSIILFFGAVSLQAQNDLPDEQIEVIKGFEVKLATSSKIKIVPQPTQLDSSVRHYTYQLLAPSPSIEYLVPELKPLAIQPEKKPTSYPFYAKAGYGSPNSLLGALSYDHVGSEAFQWGVDLRHLSANNKKIPLQKFSDTEGRLNASYQLTEKVALNGYLNGHFETVYFYGAENIPPNEESLKRAFNRYDGYVEIAQTHAPETSFTYKGFLQYLVDKDDLGSSEAGYKIGGEVGTALGTEEHPMGLRLLIDHSTLEHTEVYALNNALLQPYFDYMLGAFKFHLSGIALLNKQQNEILPDLSVDYFLTNSRLTLEAGWKGDVLKNNFHFLSSYNPYIDTRLDSLTNMVSRSIYAKLKGGTGSLTYEVTGTYSSFKGMSFFLQNKNEPHEFDVIYDAGNYFGISASLALALLKHVDLRAQVYQRFYSPEAEAKPWHRPSTEVNGQLTYNGGDDVYHVSILTTFRNGLPYRTVGGTEDVLSPLIDVSLHGDYYFTQALGAFVELNNLAGNKSERWAGYPGFGFNAKAGVLVRL
jgi:hypothetical protein